MYQQPYRRPHPGHRPPQRPGQGPRRRKKRNKLKKWALPALLAAVAAAVIIIIVVVNARPETVVGPSGLTFDRIKGPPWTIALDAGHGGNDVGAQGVISEVDLTEKTVTYLYDLLEQDPDFRPVLCREMGAGAEISQRTGAARAARASLLLSVHGNSGADADSVGFECYPAPPGREYHNASLTFAEIIAAEMQNSGATLRGEGGVRYLYYKSTDEKVFREASDTTEYEMRSFGVVEDPGCPAVLAEQCFVTSPQDVELFGSDEGCQRAANSYYQAIRSFLNNQQPA